MDVYDDSKPQELEPVGCCKQFGLLGWKNCTLAKRKPTRQLCECFCPPLVTLLFGLLINLNPLTESPNGWSLVTDGDDGTPRNIWDPYQTLNGADYENEDIDPTADFPIFSEIKPLVGMVMPRYIFEPSYARAPFLVTDRSVDTGLPFLGYRANGNIDDGTTPIPSYIAIMPRRTDNAAVQQAIDSLVNFVDETWAPSDTTFVVDNVTDGYGGRLPSFKDIAYYPGNTRFTEGNQDTTFKFGPGSSREWKTSSDVLDYITGSDYMESYPCETTLTNDSGECFYPQVFAMIVVNSVGAEGWDYEIRMNQTSGAQGSDGWNYFSDEVAGSPPTSTTFGNANVNDLQVDMNLIPQQMYANNGFMTLQLMMDRYIINGCDSQFVDCLVPQNPIYTREEKEATVARILGFPDSEFPDAFGNGLGDWISSELYLPQTVHAMAMPVQEYVINDIYGGIAGTFSLLYIIILLPPLAGVLTDLVVEKETKMREVLRIYGVGQSSLILSWYTWYTIKFLFIAILMSLCSTPQLFPNSDGFILFVFYFFFLMSIMTFGFMAAQMFDQSKTASVVGTLLWFVCYFMDNVVLNGSVEDKQAASLLAPVAFSQGLGVISALEGVNRGATPDNLDAEFGNYTVGTAIGFFIADSILYTLIGLYIDAVRPKEFGKQYEPWFFILPSFWFPSYFAKPAIAAGGVELQESGMLVQDEKSTPKAPVKVTSIEPVGQDLKIQETENRCVTITNLRKTFDTPDGLKVAVKSLNMNMYEGQIFVLLGHNGAGKTTTISMMTGLIPVTSGDATIRGLSIKEKMSSIRRTLGFCPQHDVLFDDLTVREHLEFYAGLKGYDKQKVKEAADEKIREVGLTEKEHVRSKSLSGGMKRKLSVGIALMGDSRIVFLDEPTSGMDPFSRRSTWDIIQNGKDGRVIVLTTHFMDEADLLGDRIAIMAEGELRCCGSSLFLKKRYGAGYCLTLIKIENNCDEQGIKALVKKMVPAATILSDVGAEMSFQMPIGASKQFPGLFNAMDANKSKLGIDEYGISVTTMEEVFLKVAHGTDMTVEDMSLNRSMSRQMSSKKMSLESQDVAEAEPMVKKKWERPSASASLFPIHFFALLTKRFQYAKRDRQAVCCNTVTPVVVFMIGLIILKTTGITDDPPEYTLHSRNGGNAWSDFNSGGTTPVPYNDVFNGDGLVSDLFSPANVENYGASNVAVRQQNSGCTNSNGDVNSCNVKTFTTTEGDRGAAGPDETYMYNDPNFMPPDVTYEQSVYFGSPPYNVAGLDLDFNASTAFIGYDYFNVGFSEETPSQYGGFAIFNYYNGGMPQIEYTVVHNTTGIHTLPTFQNFMANMLSFRNGGPAIYVSNYPFPNTARLASSLESVSAFTAVLFLMIAYSFIPASIVQFVVREKENNRNAKHQQMISGVSIPAYWFSNFAWDLLMYLAPFLLTIILIAAFDIQALTGNGCEVACIEDPLGAVTVLLFMFGLSVIPFTYCLSYLFNESAKAQTFTIMLSIFSGALLMIASFIMRLIPATCAINRQLLFVYRIVPLFSLGNGLLNMASGIFTLEAGDCYDIDDYGGRQTTYDAFELEIIGYEVIYMAWTSVFFTLLAIGMDVALSYPKLAASILKDPVVADKPYDVDDDVEAEAQRVLSGRADGDMIVIKGLRKVYGGSPSAKVAVKNLTFAIPKGECFGFLGINGAGKTTSLKILSGDYIPSEGSATLGGYDILTQQIECRRLIGYCPQFDSLLDLCTVREHLELFAKVKGVPPEFLEEVVMEKMTQMDLTNFEHKLAGKLSGGNKRKLSVGIALIGSPQIVFLDEPSTGMDPVARRFMWDVISDTCTKGKNCSVSLTTHSMEECEALCTRLGIMVGGRMRCMGGPQHLKNKFGQGLQMEVRLSEVEHNSVVQMANLLPGGESGMVTHSTLQSACELLGDASRFAWCNMDSDKGWLVAEQLRRHNSLRNVAFCEWWIGENRAIATEGMMSTKFGAELLERHGDQFRFAVKNLDHTLAEIFTEMEAARSEFFIREYSVSQTTLEQIFNQFASQQEEEQGPTRGITKADAKMQRQVSGYRELTNPGTPLATEESKKENAKL